MYSVFKSYSQHHIQILESCIAYITFRKYMSEMFNIMQQLLFTST